MKKTTIKLTEEFKRQTTRAIAAIAVFVFTYLLLLILAVALMALSIYAGIMFFAFYPGFFSVIVAIGLTGMGVLVLIFLVKFIFSKQKVDRSHLYEITREDEPRLFNLIDGITKQVDAKFPKRVYLSNDVNAAVFYDSNFWSMFFPVKKNLQIGMGLVNIVTKPELEAILGHEFGHFSQRTMKVGSYVYNVNRIIFNLLYDNESYDRLVKRWTRVHGYFSFFAIISVKIISVIQWVLRKQYEAVNKSHLGLSREMEFNADEIASHVAGYKPLKTALLRMPFADHAFNAVLSFYDRKVAANLKSGNLYRDQLFVMNFLAEYNSIPLVNGFPDVQPGELNKFDKSKLVIVNQWASHPSTEDRIKRLEVGNVVFDQKDKSPANYIFTDFETTQRLLTKNVFEKVVYPGEPNDKMPEEFQSEFRAETLENSFSKLYNGYYDNKNPVAFNLNMDTNVSFTSCADLFSDQKVSLVYTVISLQNDIETLKQIAENEFVKTFDYDGKKYTSDEAGLLANELKLQLNEVTEEISKNDANIYAFFKRQESDLNAGYILDNLYREFFQFDEVFSDRYQVYTILSGELQFVHVTTPFDVIRSNFARIAALEKKLKTVIKELLADEKNRSLISDEMRANFELYCSKQWEYFDGNVYLEEELNRLFIALNDYADLLSKKYFLLKKELLKYQEDLMLKSLQSEPLM